MAWAATSLRERVAAFPRLSGKRQLTAKDRFGTRFKRSTNLAAVCGTGCCGIPGSGMGEALDSMLEPLGHLSATPSKREVVLQVLDTRKVYPLSSTSMQIDGAHGEGGGQLVRTAVALAAITGTAVHLGNIRARRHPAGLAPQHLAAVRAVAALCGARCEGLALRSLAFDFVPGSLGGGEFAFDVGTAGSATLVLQALLPAMSRAPRPCRVRVTGGTDVRAAPPLDYLRHVLLPLLRRMGIEAVCTVRRRGYYPRGGGEVEVAVAPANPRPLSLTSPGRLLCVEGLAHAANLPAHIPERMREAALTRLGKVHVPVAIEQEVLGSGEALGEGGAIVLWARTEHCVLGAGRVAERGVRAEALGEAAAAELAADLEAGAALDMHAADQLLVYLALAGPGSVVTVREVSRHAETVMWLIEQFLPARFSVTDADGLKRVQVLPA